MDIGFGSFETVENGLMCLFDYEQMMNRWEPIAVLLLVRLVQRTTSPYVCIAARMLVIVHPGRCCALRWNIFKL